MAAKVLAAVGLPPPPANRLPEQRKSQSRRPAEPEVVRSAVVLPGRAGGDRSQLRLHRDRRAHHRPRLRDHVPRSRTCPGVDLVLPEFTYLRERADQVDGIVLTHGHEDHTGGLAYLLRDLKAPIYGSELTVGLARHRVEEAGLADRTKFVIGQGRRAPARSAPATSSSSRPPTRCPTPSPSPSTPRRASSCTRATSSSTSNRSTAGAPTWPAWASWPRPRGSASSSPTPPTPRSRASPPRSHRSASRCAGSSPPTRASASSWPASPATCTGCSRSSTPPWPTAARWPRSVAPWARTSSSAPAWA